MIQLVTENMWVYKSPEPTRVQLVLVVWSNSNAMTPINPTKSRTKNQVQLVLVVWSK